MCAFSKFPPINFIVPVLYIVSLTRTVIAPPMVVRKVVRETKFLHLLKIIQQQSGIPNLYVRVQVFIYCTVASMSCGCYCPQHASNTSRLYYQALFYVSGDVEVPRNFLHEHFVCWNHHLFISSFRPQSSQFLH